MDYHSDRFKDFSLMIYDDTQLVAILPANRLNDTLYSHQGLTYGGFIFRDNLTDFNIKDIFKSVFKFLGNHGVNNLELKLLPEFYHFFLSNPFSKYLTTINVNSFRTDKVLAINFNDPLKIHKTKLKHFRKNEKKGFKIKEESDLTLFWDKVLIPRLKEKHGVKPVHSLEEIRDLKLKFPNNIRQFNIYLDSEILAGITIFDKGEVIKSQYGATTIKGEKERALEFLFLKLIYKFKEEGKFYFSMGTVRDLKKPLGYNESLKKHKEELGCKVYAQKFYKISIP